MRKVCAGEAATLLSDRLVLITQEGASTYLAELVLRDLGSVSKGGETLQLTEATPGDIDYLESVVCDYINDPRVEADIAELARDAHRALFT